MGNSHVCRRCLRGEDASGGAGPADGSRLIVAVDEFSEAVAVTTPTPSVSETGATGNGSNSTPTTPGGAAPLESDSLMPPSSGGPNARLLSHAGFSFTTDEASMSWLRANRVMFLMRGLPGSGKSTLTRLLSQLYPGSTVCSADNYFINKSTGEYCFVAAKIKDAHSACNNWAHDALSSGKSPVIIDNTNVRRWEFKFYTDLATRFGYVLLVVVPKTPWRFDAQELANKTTHSVPLNAIEERLRIWEPAHPLFYAWYLDSAGAARLLRLARDFLTCLVAATATAPRFPVVPAESARPLLHVTARFCGTHGVSQNEAVAQIDYHNRPDVQASLGKLFQTSVTAVFATPRTVGFKVDLTPEQLSLWDNDLEGSHLPRGCRAHVTLVTAPKVANKQTGLDLLAILSAVADNPEPSAEELVLMTEWGFARGCGPDSCLLTLDEPIRLSTMFASAY